MSDTINIIKDRFQDVVTDSHSQHGDDTVTITKDSVLEVMQWLRDDERTAFNFLMDLTAVDYLGKGKSARFEVVYHLYSLKNNNRLRVKAAVSEDDATINSLAPLWKGADWYEREVYDLYGITFNGHPNMKRILLYEGFEGHPLRKDYPIDKRQPLIGPDN